MARKIICENCNAETYDTPSCGRCGASIARSSNANTLTDEQKERIAWAKLVYRIGMVERAEQVNEKLKAITLARFEAVQDIDGVKMSNTKVVVERGRNQFVYTNSDQNPVKLAEGQYSLGKIMLAGGGTSTEFAGLICEISTTPITMTFVFPDRQSFNDGLFDGKKPPPNWLQLELIDEAVNSLSLRTSDDHLGGATLQIRLHCEDPIKLIRCQDGQLGRKFKSPLGKPGLDSPETTIAVPDKRWWWKRMWDNLRGEEPIRERTITTETRRIKNITMADLYPLIRLELAEAIGNSIRDFGVQALYNKQDTNRDRLHESIKRYMEKTLQGYGLKIADVVAFQFRSPDYEEFLQQRGDNTLQKQRLENDKMSADNRRSKGELDHEEFKHIENLEKEKDHLGVDRGEELQKKLDEIASKRLHRNNQLETEKQNHHLTLERQRLEFEREQRDAETKRALEYHAQLQQQQLKVIQEMQNADHERRLAAVKLIASYPPDQQFLLAMQYNPELQMAFVALQQAKSQQDKLIMAESFQHQIQTIYGQQSDQTNALLIEAAKQLGLVASAKAISSV